MGWTDVEVPQAFVVKSKRGHNWVVAGGERIGLLGAEGSGFQSAVG